MKNTFLTVALLLGCSNPPNAKAVELDLCQARAAYKLAAAEQGGKWDPAPGSARATLETEEDAFCATIGR
jgi:hypothetical protein